MQHWERRDEKRKPLQKVHGRSVQAIINAVAKRYKAIKGKT